jgi:hypothetical protein
LDDQPMHYQSALRQVVLLIGAVLSLEGSAARSQSPQLTVFMGKGEFFEGEPIYVVVEVSNAGRDTIWVPIPSLTSRWMKATLRRVDGSVVAERMWNVTVIVPPGWRGEELAPGAAYYQTIILQDVWGTPRGDPSELFIGNLATGEYTFRVDFNLSFRGEAAPVLHSREARFAIRQRGLAEDAEYEQVKAIRRLAWGRATRDQYVPALVDWVSRRLVEDSEDPYLPFLLNEGIQTATAVGARWPYSEFRQRLLTLRLAVAAAQSERPAGAHALSGGFNTDAASMPAMPGKFGGTLAGAVGVQLEVQTRDHQLFGRGPIHP